MKKRNILLLVFVALFPAFVVSNSLFANVRPEKKHTATAAAVRDDAQRVRFENSIETDHFILKWTNRSKHVADNIADPGIIHETAGYLETAWEKYTAAFGRTPYVRPGSNKIEVVFYDISGYAAACPPEGPIQFDARNWVKRPGIRQPTSAHELFHKLQYAFGYKTRWNPKSPFKWFTEGTATWAEVFVWGRVSTADKLNGLFREPQKGLYSSEYSALPFWIFFQTRLQSSPDHNAMVDFFKEYEATRGNEKKALARVIERHALAGLLERDWPSNNGSSPLDSFFALFARERQLGSWRRTQSGELHYRMILDPYGRDITPKLHVTDVSIKKGENYRKSESILRLGSKYYRFRLGECTDGETITISISGGSSGACSYYLGWGKDDEWNSISLSGIAGDHGYSERIHLKAADSLILIVCGQGRGGSYKITASVS